MSGLCLVSAVADRRYRRNFVIQRIRLKPSAVAFWTGSISAIPTEQHAHVHFVNLRFEPAKESAHAVPAIAFVIVVAGFARAPFAVDDKILIGFWQFLKWHIDVDLFASTGAEQVLLRFAELLSAKNANRALFY